MSDTPRTDCEIGNVRSITPALSFGEYYRLLANRLREFARTLERAVVQKDAELVRLREKNARLGRAHDDAMRNIHERDAKLDALKEENERLTYELQAERGAFSRKAQARKIEEDALAMMEKDKENAWLTALVAEAREIIGDDFAGKSVDYRRCADWLRRAGEGK